MSTEADFLAQKLQEHDTKALRAEVDELKANQRRTQETLDTLILPNGGEIALPYIAPEGGEGSSTQRPGGTTRTINVFTDGTLEALEVLVDSSSSFGPF